MGLEIYNTLANKKERFVPLSDKVVKMYVCGPTVYDYDHLGHGRVGIFYDIVRRYLMKLGYKVIFVQNITDVGHLTGTETGEDKIEKRAKSAQKSPREIAKFYEKEHFQDMTDLNVLKPDFSPRASEFIPKIIKYIEKLIDAGYAYQVLSGVYFNVSKFKGYGELSGRDFEKGKEGHRIQLKNDKKNIRDFALWRRAEPGHILKWDSPWGAGYPGWHIECSVMSQNLLGQTLDIHGGAIELAFPHHENEIAQSESISQKPFVRFWMHIGLVMVEGEKMSKSKGNVINIRKLLEKYNSDLIRLTILATHYRKPFDYKDEIFTQNKKILSKLIIAKKSAPLKTINDHRILIQIKEALNDDFNTPLALNLWFKNREKIGKKLFKKLAEIFGLKLEISKKIPTEILKKAKERERARGKQNWERADLIRKEIEEKGYLIEDKEKGFDVRKQ